MRREKARAGSLARHGFFPSVLPRALPVAQAALSMTRPAIRHLVQQARPRPGAGDVSSGRLFRFQSSAACAPLAHPTGDKGHFAPTSNVKSYGQPLPSTHPHLLQPGELTPCISANEYHERRQRLVDSLEDGAVVIIAGGQIQYMTQNIL